MYSKIEEIQPDQNPCRTSGSPLSSFQNPHGDAHTYSTYFAIVYFLPSCSKPTQRICNICLLKSKASCSRKNIRPELHSI